MEIFLYEYATAGGAWESLHSPDLVRDLHAEGRAMWSALAHDLTRAGHAVVTMCGPGALDSLDGVTCVATREEHQRRQAFAACVRNSEATLLIAPEIGGILESLARQVEQRAGRLLSPDSGFVALTSNKQATAEYLQRHGVPVPTGRVVEAGATWTTEWPEPMVRKPLDGAGSLEVELLVGPVRTVSTAMRVEPYCPGLAASVAVLCGPRASWPLEPCSQRLGGATGFQYLGGSLPLDPDLRARARQLAVAALAALPPTTGYVGVDLVLGPLADGSRDVVIEINPRLTTSYVGLRVAARHNLAAALVQVACGESPELSFDPAPLEFVPDGRVWRETESADRASNR